MLLEAILKIGTKNFQILSGVPPPPPVSAPAYYIYIYTDSVKMVLSREKDLNNEFKLNSDLINIKAA